MSAGSIFTAQIGQFVSRAKGNADLVVRKVALEMFSRVIQKTPVDTGRARGSWCVGINAIPPDTVEPNDKDGSTTIARVAADTLAVKAGDVVTMVSSLSYSRRLEYGWSKQAPAGMVRTTIAEWNSVVTAAASELPK